MQERKMLLFITLFISLFFVNCKSQEKNGFEVCLFGNNNDMPTDCVELDDNSILIIGQHFPEDYYSNENHKVASLVKLNKDGEFLWEKSFGHSKDDRFSHIIRKDGYLYIIGTTMNSDRTQKKVWVLKLDLEGNIIKESKFGEDAEGLDIKIDSDNEMYLCGRFFSNNESRKYDNPAYYLIKLDTGLNIIWDKIIEQKEGFHRLENIHINNESIYLVGKYLNGNLYQSFIKQYNKNGEEISTNNILSSEIDPLIPSIYNKGKIIIATNNEIQRNVIDFFILDVVSNKQTRKQVILKNNISVSDFIIDHQGKYVVAGRSWGGVNNFYFVKINNEFQIEVENNYGYPLSRDGLSKCIELEDKSILTLGYSNFETKTQYCNKWIIKKIP